MDKYEASLNAHALFGTQIHEQPREKPPLLARPWENWMRVMRNPIEAERLLARTSPFEPDAHSLARAPFDARLNPTGHWPAGGASTRRMTRLVATSGCNGGSKSQVSPTATC